MLRKGEINSTQIVEECFNNVQKFAHLNSFISTTDKQNLLSKAQSIDQKRKKGEAVGILNGLPIAIKDNFNVQGTLTSCASKMLSNYISPYTATVCQKLIDSDGLIIGKTNLDEFAMGSFTSNSHYGPTINPYPSLLNDQSKDQYYPGGSSGGSAVAVATSQCYGALGSDTGGSVRLPASWCNIVGLKPSYGLCSRYGLVSYASSLDTPAIFTRTVEDSALLLDIIAGYDPNDSTSIKNPATRNYNKDIQELSGVTVGIPLECNVEELPEEIEDAWNEGIGFLKARGARVKFVSLPNMKYALPAYYIIAPAEASSNLARYDGLRYGITTPTFENTREAFTKTREMGFGDEVKRRILVGTFVLSSSSYKDYFLQAAKVRSLVREDFSNAFKEVDVLLTPTSTGLPPKLNSTHSQQNPLEEFLNDLMTIPASMAGVPAISVPMPISEKGIPVGLQLIANYLEESKLLNIATVLQQINN
uniref:Glutamyl-tRNA(Gln) amidotransferase subunit A, mitochondrial n=1 Tax=Arcella intermedia TaxID=1963864 RepID=A0A6B2L2T2_9EUKA